VEDKKRQILLKKRNNGGLKTNLYGSRKEMKTQSFFIGMTTT
jgi:hypothetical protein